MKSIFQGDLKIDAVEEYNSNNTEHLNVARVKEKLLKLNFIREELRKWRESS